MKKLLLIIILFSCSFAGFSQAPVEEKIEKKAAAEPDSKRTADGQKPKYEMKKYWFVMLTRGKTTNQDSATIAALQKAHLDNITRLHAMGKILVAGPFADKGDWRGIFIMDCKDQQEAEELLKSDEMIKAGRLNYEIHPWWTAKNEVFK